MNLYDGIRLFDRLYLTTKSPEYRKWVLGRIGMVDGGLRPNSLAAVLGDVEMGTVSAEMLQEWVNSLCGQTMLYADQKSSRPARFGSLAPSTIDGYRRALSTFWKWACAYHVRTGVGGDVTVLLAWPDPPRADEAPPRAAEEADVRDVLGLITISARDEALIRFLVSTGVRISEAVGLTWKNVYLVQRYAHVWGKGRGGRMKVRAVVFDRPTATALKVLRGDRITSEHVFMSEQGTPLTTDGARQMLRRRAREAGLPEAFSPHRLRHLWGILSVQAGLHDNHAQDQLGHSDPRTTKRYKKFVPLQRLQAYDEAFGEGVLPVRSRLRRG
ncbi:MAG: tyrosine-type recombinase/integrase [Chloroflexi bacterium]|nr:tyrosine-type recombinase/integrase [Chloroflexota bacterium]